MNVDRLDVHSEVLVRQLNLEVLLRPAFAEPAIARNGLRFHALVIL